MGLRPWQVFEALEGSGASGLAMAADASCHPTNRSVHIIGGTGGFAWCGDWQVAPWPRQID